MCADCRTSFQIVTHKTGRFEREAAIAPSVPVSGDPTTGCALCDSLNLAMVSEGPPVIAVCGDCRAILEVAIEDVSPP
ncbi:MAG: hypothetical protein JO041_04790 [Acidobacteria bacterium]|nr:hypothetical protein [Acidobacteriota bacterium]